MCWDLFFYIIHLAYIVQVNIAFSSELKHLIGYVEGGERGGGRGGGRGRGG